VWWSTSKIESIDQSVKHGDGACKQLGQLRGTAIEETRDIQTLADVETIRPTRELLKSEFTEE